MKRIVIFASGSGTNAENIIKYFKNRGTAKVVRVLSNKKDAKVIERCKKLGVACNSFTKQDFFENDTVVTILKKEADFIALAGFLWKVPQKIIKLFPNKILNIHPALLPKYGGKGMYGMHVHNAVVKNKEKYSGITIHYVNENYDDGAIVFQEKIEVLVCDTAKDVATKIHHLEYKHFPVVIEKVIKVHE